MSVVLAVVDARSGDPAVAAVAASLASTLSLHLRVYPHGPSDPMTAALAAISGPDVAIAVVPRSLNGSDDLTEQLVLASTKPLVVVPVTAPSAAEAVARVLVPLDDTEVSAAAVSSIVELFSDSGADVVVLHVFGAGEVPHFWDQPVHADTSWSEEFRARHCDWHGGHIELRTGRPGEVLVAVAAQERADLIALAWSQSLDPERAAVVRAALADAPVPVMLMPVRELP